MAIENPAKRRFGARGDTFGAKAIPLPWTVSALSGSCELRRQIAVKAERIAGQAGMR
jgi:hypothetical protein